MGMFSTALKKKKNDSNTDDKAIVKENNFTDTDMTMQSSRGMFSRAVRDKNGAYSGVRNTGISQKLMQNEYDKALRYVGYKTKYDAMTEKERADSLSELNGKRTSADISEGDARRYQEEYDWILGSYEDDAVKKEARKNTYEDNERRIAEIDKKLAPVIRGGGTDRLLITPEEEKALESEKASLEAENTLYRRTQEVMDRYSEYTKNEDFGTVSARRDITNPSKEELIDFPTKNAYAGYTLAQPIINDKLGLYLSNYEEAFDDKFSYEIGDNPYGDVIREGGAKSWDRLQPEEIDIYYYILNSEGVQAAYKYLDDMETELTRREQEEQKKAIDSASTLEKIGYSVASIPMNVYGGATGIIDDASRILAGKDINPYSFAHFGTNYASNVRESTSDAIAKATEGAELFGQNIPEFLYQTGMSMADSILGAATMGNAYTVMMGMNAATSEAKRLYESGASKLQIAAGGLLAGAAEAVFEKLSLDRLLKEKDIRSVGQLVKEILAQGGVEASEEVFTEITNKLTNQVVMGANSDYSKAVEAYIADGKSRSEAEALAFMDSVGDVIWAGAGGFLSGAGMGAAFDTVQYHNNLANEGRTVIGQKGTDSLKSLAMEMAKQEGVNEDKLTGLSDKVGKKASAKNVGKLSFAVENASRAQNIAEITRSLKEDGMSAREAGKTAKTLYSALDGEYFDDSFANKLDPENSSYDEKTANTYYSMIGNDESSVNKRNDKYALARRGITVNDKGESVLSDALAKDTIEKAANEVALSKVSSQNRFEVNTGAVNAEDDAVIPMTSEEAERFKGKTTVYDAETDTHREVKIAGVHSIKDGEMMLKLDDGSVVNARDVRYASDGEAVLYNAVLDMGVNAGVAQALINNYDKADGVSAGKYVLGIRDAYFYGKMNIPLNQLSENSFTHYLTAAQRNFAYTLGHTEAKAAAKSKQKAIDEKMAKAKEKGEVKKKSGKLIVEDGVAVDENGSIDESVLTDVQKANLIGVKALAELSPINFHVFRSEKVDGEYRYTMPDGSVTKANGVYMVGSNDIWIDLNSGDMGEGTMLWTASHEISHYIKERAPVRWKSMAVYLVKLYSRNQDVSLSELLDRQKSKVLAREGADSLSEEEVTDAAYEELVSDALSDMLTDGSVIEALAEIKKTDKGLWQTIKDAVAALLERWGEVLGIYRGRTPDAAEAQALSGMKKAYYKLQKMYAEAFAEANAVEEAEAYLKENGVEVITDGKQEAASINSVRNLLNETERQKVAKAIATRFDVTVEEATEWIKAETSMASLILNPKYSQYLDYEADDSETAIKQNSDYPQGTVDFSNICKKRRAFTEVMNRVLRNFPDHVFLATDLARIRTIMSEEKMEVACAICYVEDRRQLDSIVAQNFLDSLELYRKGSKTRPDGKPFNAQQIKAMKLIEGDTYTPSIYELVTLEGRNALKAKNPNMEEAWVTFNNARGMQTVRLLTNEAEYKRQILKYNKNTVKSKNDVGGLRIYSFSDLEMFHLIDIIQVITDSAAVGLKIQGYTKVNEYAKAVKDTGEKLNRSLIPAGDLGYHIEDGKVVLDYDTVEGIDINHPDFFDSTDNPDVGNIVIGINETQIRAAMVSEFIDYIIPFHTGQSKEVLREKGLAEWHNYEDSQSERDLTTGNKSEHQINIYTEVIEAAEKEGKPIKNKVDFVNKFLAVCKENGLKPRFSEFLNIGENGDYVYTEGYHKFLVDFKTFDSRTGEYLPQMPVKPKFDDGYITGLLEDYAKGQKAKDEELAMKMPKVIDRITKEIVKPEAKPSERNNDSMSNRAILANAIESSVQTEIERKKLQDYRENIDSLYENEAKLSELNRQIKELSFAEGKRDTKKLKELREEAVKTANRINIYDKKLLRLEPFLSKVLDREKARVRKQEKTKYKASLAEYREKRDAREEAMKTKHKASLEKFAEYRARRDAREEAMKAKHKARLTEYREKRDAREKSMKAEYKERLAKYREKRNDREEAKIAKLKESSKERLAKYRAKRDDREKAMKAKWKESREKASVKRKASVIRDKIKSLKTKMEEDLQKPTERRYVPARLVGAIVDVCGLINTDTPLIKKNGEVSRAQEKRNQTKEKLQALKDEYEKLGKDADPMYKGEYDETVYAYLSKLKDDYADKNLSDMSLEELTQLYDILRSVYETLRDARKLIGQNEAKSVYEVGDAIAEEQASIAKSRKKDKRSPAQKAKDKSFNYTLSPMRNVERMSGYNEDSALVKLFRDFESGIRKKNKFVMESYKMFQALTTGENKSVYEDSIYKGYGDKTYTDINGRRFAVSKMEMMQAILTLEREEANGEIHLQRDGISFADLTMLGKGRLKDAVSEEYSHRVPAAVEMIKGFAEELKNDAWAQAYMAAARSFFNEKAKNAINETTMITKHRVIAATKNYIPKEVDRKFITREISAENDIQQTINSYGMLKDTVKNASQPLIMTGLNNVIDRHIEQVGNVYGLSVPVRNFNKVWNVRTNEGRDTVKSLIEKYWGTEGANSIEQTVKDIQGPRINNQSDMYRKLRSNYIGATFLLNLSVVSKQIGSLFAANSMLKYRGPIRMLYNLGYTMKNYKKLSAEVDKYTASVWMRRQGVSDGELYSLMTQGKKSFFGKLNNKLPESIRPTSWIAGMDSAVALSLWKYAKEDVAKRTGLKGEELLKATADYFDSVIENTQSMADVLHRPEVQKRGDLASDILGMFKTDLYQMAGQLNVTFGRFMANKTAENRAALGRTIYSVAMSAIWGQLMSVLFSFIRYKVKPFRDDDTDEVTFGGVMKRSLFGLLGDLAGYVIPLAGSEAVGVVENIVYGESDEIADNIVISAVNSLYDAILRTAGKIRDGKALSVSDFSSIATKALQLAGVPANNLYRFGQSINLYAKDIANGEMFSYNAGAELTTANRMSRITNAYTSGKTEMAKNMYEDYLEELAISKAKGEEVTDEARNEAKSNLKSALGKKYKEGDIEREYVEDMLEELFGMDDEDIYWTMDEWDYAAENGSDDDYEKYGEFYEAVETGVNLKAVIKRYTDNGIAKKTLAKRITDYYKPKYRAMTKGERASIKGYLLNAYVYLGYDRSKKSKDIDAWLKEDDEED